MLCTSLYLEQEKHNTRQNQKTFRGKQKIVRVFNYKTSKSPLIFLHWLCFQFPLQKQNPQKKSFCYSNSNLFHQSIKMEGGGTVTCGSWIKRPENVNLVVLGKSSRASSSPSVLEIFSFDPKTTSVYTSPLVKIFFFEKKKEKDFVLNWFLMFRWLFWCGFVLFLAFFFFEGYLCVWWKRRRSHDNCCEPEWWWLCLLYN